jgi:hypothetical protein
MSKKHFCDKCGAEIDLPGNDYGTSQVVFARTLGHEDGWRVNWQIRREYEGNNTDLCRRCTFALIKHAVEALKENFDAHARADKKAIAL